MIDDSMTLYIISVRLVGGTTESEGRVEVFYEGAWATVCDDFWDDDDAAVVCASLGFERNGTAVSLAAFGEGEGEIALDDVGCTGTESNIAACPHLGLGLHNCVHSEDAGVRCISNTESPGKQTPFYILFNG